MTFFQVLTILLLILLKFLPLNGGGASILSSFKPITFRASEVSASESDTVDEVFHLMKNHYIHRSALTNQEWTEQYDLMKSDKDQTKVLFR